MKRPSQNSARSTVVFVCAVIIGTVGCGGISSSPDESTGTATGTSAAVAPPDINIATEGTAVEGFRRLEVYRIDDILVAKFLDSRLDDSAGDIGNEFSRLTNDSDAKSIILNFESVEFFSDTPLEKLMATKAQCDTNGKQLILCGLKGDVDQVFKIMHFDKVFTIAPNVNAGLQRARA